MERLQVMRLEVFPPPPEERAETGSLERLLAHLQRELSSLDDEEDRAEETEEELRQLREERRSAVWEVRRRLIMGGREVVAAMIGGKEVAV